MSKNRVLRVLIPLFAAAPLVPIACHREDPISSGPMKLNSNGPAANGLSLDEAFEQTSRTTWLAFTGHIDCDAIRDELTARLRSNRISLNNTWNDFVRAAIQRQIDTVQEQLPELEDECANDPDDGEDPNGDGFGDDGDFEVNG